MGSQPLAPSAPTPRRSHFQHRRAARWVDHISPPRGGNNNNEPFPISHFRTGRWWWSAATHAEIQVNICLHGYGLPLQMPTKFHVPPPRICSTWSESSYPPSNVPFISLPAAPKKIVGCSSRPAKCQIPSPSEVAMLIGQEDGWTARDIRGSPSCPWTMRLPCVLDIGPSSTCVRDMEPSSPLGDGPTVPSPSESFIFSTGRESMISASLSLQSSKTERERKKIIHTTHYLSYIPHTTMLPIAAPSMPVRQAQSPLRVPQEL